MKNVTCIWNENVQQGKVSKNVQYWGKIKEICIT